MMDAADRFVCGVAMAAAGLLQGVAAMSCFAEPNPYIPLHLRVQSFIVDSMATLARKAGFKRPIPSHTTRLWPSRAGGKEAFLHPRTCQPC